VKKIAWISLEEENKFRDKYLTPRHGCEPSSVNASSRMRDLHAAWNSMPAAAASPAMHVQETTENALFNTSFSTC